MASSPWSPLRDVSLEIQAPSELTPENPSGSVSLLIETRSISQASSDCVPALMMRQPSVPKSTLEQNLNMSVFPRSKSSRLGEIDLRLIFSDNLILSIDSWNRTVKTQHVSIASDPCD